MSKVFKFNRSDFKEISFAKNRHLYNEDKTKELYAFFKTAEEVSRDPENMKTLSRSVIEEVMNIVQHNKTWNEMEVRVKFNSQKTNCKIDIIYDGEDYYDPVENKTGNVIGSYNVFKTKPIRKVTPKTINDKKMVHIDIDVEEI